MNAYHCTYKGFPGVALENGQLKLIVLPGLGAKIASLVYKPLNFEVFSQPAEGIYRSAAYGDDFSCYDTSGADDMYPTIDPCSYPYPENQGRFLPDHGDLWSLPWRVAIRNGALFGEVEGKALPYVFTRTISLEGGKVHLNYEVSNTGDFPIYGLWAFHGLVSCDDKSQIVLPNVAKVINVHDSQVLGSAGSMHDFPNTQDTRGREYRLDRIGSQSNKKTEKYYVSGPLTTGVAALTLNNNKLLYQLNFPNDHVPYLGIWINEGGFKDEYNCALEPATGYFDSPAVASKYSSLKPLLPGESQTWYLDIKLTPYK